MSNFNPYHFTDSDASVETFSDVTDSQLPTRLAEWDHEHNNVEATWGSGEPSTYDPSQSGGFAQGVESPLTLVDVDAISEQFNLNVDPVSSNHLPYVDSQRNMSLWEWHKNGRSYRRPISSPLPSINVVDASSTGLLPTQFPREQPLIPGTEAFQNVQVARRRKKYHESSSSYDPQNPMTTQMFYNDLVAEGDPDFNEVRWTSAFQYLTQKGEELTCLNAITCTTTNWVKINKLLVMVKELNKNVFGDALATLKDPTGTMSANIHSKVFEKSDYNQHLNVGAVVLLNNVTVTKVNRSTKNLNIVVKNIVKVIGKNQMVETMVDDENLVDEELMSTIVPDSEDEM